MGEKEKGPETNGNLFEPDIKAANVSMLDTAATKELSSSAHFPAACPQNSFWLSPAEVIQFKPNVEGETVLEVVSNQIE
jgi:hypothetical protein